MNEEQEFKDLTVKYFGFLEKEFGFVYDETRNQFDTGSIRILIEEYDKRFPAISVWLKSEPKFTSISLDWLLEEYIDYKEMDKLLLEGCFQYYANIVRKHSDRIFNGSDSLFLMGVKRMLISWLKSENLTKSNYLTRLTGENSKYYYYIKQKDGNWDPGKEL